MATSGSSHCKSGQGSSLDPEFGLRIRHTVQEYLRVDSGLLMMEGEIRMKTSFGYPVRYIGKKCGEGKTEAERK